MPVIRLISANCLRLPCMVDPPAQTFFDALVAFLGHPSIVACESRRSLRRQTGSLLEEAFLALAVASAPDLSVEIGAHEASFSSRLKQRLPRVRALAFEANPYVFDRYTRGPDNRLSDVDYRNAAICDTLGTVNLFIPTRWSKGTFDKANAISSLHRRNSLQFDYETVSVPSLTLDAAVEAIAFTNAVA